MSDQPVTEPTSPLARIRGLIDVPSILTTFLAVVLALLVGAVIVAIADEDTVSALPYLAARPADALGAGFSAAVAAYVALFQGSFGSLNAVSETLVAATPLILTGLAVTVPFRAGLFNIGGEGQVIVGGATAGLVGFSLTGLPAIIHLPLALLAGLAGGALYGALPGLLKAKTGAHEVISTIMLNNIAGLVLIEVLVTGLFQAPGRSDPISKGIQESAALPVVGGGFRLDAGLLIALAAGAAIWWLLTRSTLGFEIRAVGANAVAATTAGMSAARTTVTTMAIAGGLAGLGGAGLILGAAGQGTVTPGFASGVGFDGITVALLGRGKPWGTVVAGVVFGALKAGGRTMQSQTSTPVDLVLVIQALVILFIAAPVLIRALFRLKETSEATKGVAAGWGA